MLSQANQTTKNTESLPRVHSLTNKTQRKPASLFVSVSFTLAHRLTSIGQCISHSRNVFLSLSYHFQGCEDLKKSIIFLNLKLSSVLGGTELGRMDHSWLRSVMHLGKAVSWSRSDCIVGIPQMMAKRRASLDHFAKPELRQ